MLVALETVHGRDFEQVGMQHAVLLAFSVNHAAEMILLQDGRGMPQLLLQLPRQGALPRPGVSSQHDQHGQEPSAVSPQPDLPVQDGQVVVDEWQAERDQLAVQVQRAKSQARQAREQAKQARTKLRTITQERDRLARDLSELQQATGRAADDGALFVDPVDQLRFEVELAWARRIPAGQKAERPLKPWVVGAEFLSSLDQTPDVDRAKVVDVIVEICTGLVEQMPGRDLHQLRTSDGGNAAPMTRSDGAVCWRAALQQVTSQARRIHYWVRRDQVIELSSVRLHDDLKP